MDALCAACGQPTSNDAETCAACGGRTRLRDRYLLHSIVGQGAVGVTYRATDLAAADDGALVAIKEMPLRHTDPELARRVAREASVLAQLHHDRIPAYVEDFTVGVGKQQVFYLVQAFVAGPTLADEMARRRYTEDEVLAILD
ncbi:MAG: protein kinase, partial [Myxococcales bacterium]|nr:protein kinase [Myxococcales bacterium]